MTKIKKIVEVLLVAILLLTANVYAANDSFKVNLSADKTQVKRGENVKITIALSDIAIESGEKGIGAYTANIDFDSSILEYVSTDGTDKWEAPLYQEKLIAGNTDDGQVVNTAQNIGTVTFKVKEDAKLGDTTIKVTNFSGSTAATDVATNDVSIKITILEKDNGSGSGNQGGNTTGGNTTGGSTAGGNTTGGNTAGGNTTGGSTTGGNLTGSGSTGGNVTGNSIENGVSNGSQNSSGNGSAGGSTQTEKDSLKQGVLPQTGYTNVLIFSLIAVCALVMFCVFVKLKIVDRKIKKDN